MKHINLFHIQVGFGILLFLLPEFKQENAAFL